MDEEIKAQERWFLSLSYSDKKEIIREKLQNMSRDFIVIGYCLKSIRDDESYKQDGYSSIWEFAEDNYGIKRTTASRWMAMNDKFSEGGNTPILAEEFRMFGKSQLQEMLYLEDNQLDQVTPDMTVKEIREVREPEKKLMKPDQNQTEYLNAFARYFIDCKHDWLLQDFQNRVMHVDKSPEEIKNHLGVEHRTWYFATDNGAAHINLFDDYVQLWDEGNVCLGDFDWFYFAAALQSMWNIVAMENAQKEQKTECATSHKIGTCIHRPEFPCTLPDASKLAVGDGIDCNKKCCWDCLKRMECGYRCNSAAGHPMEEEQILGQMNVEDYPEILPEPEKTDTGIDNSEDNVVIERPEIVINQPESVIDTEYCEVNEDKPDGPDAMLTCLVEACMEEFDFDKLSEESEDIEEFQDWVYDELFGTIVRFWFESREYKAEFLGDIGVENVDTGEKIYQRYVWKQFFEELARVGNIGERYAAENAESCCQNAADLDELTFSEIAIRDYLEEEEKTLEEYTMCDQQEKGFPQRLLQKQQMLVKALRLLMKNEADQEEREADESEEIFLKGKEFMSCARNSLSNINLEVEHKAWKAALASAGHLTHYLGLVVDMNTDQPELPAMKNNDQRKEWLKNYKDWGLWYRDENIDVNYYKYDFSDGSRLVVAEYPKRRMYWKPNEFADEHHYHLIDKHREWYGTDKTFEQQYVHSTDSETSLVEFLKNLQKGEKK